MTSESVLHLFAANWWLSTRPLRRWTHVPQENWCAGGNSAATQREMWSLHAAKGEWGYEVEEGHMYDDRDIGDNETGVRTP